MNIQMPDPKVQIYHCQDCNSTVQGTAIFCLRNGFVVLFECQCPRSNLVIIASDMKTMILSNEGQSPKSVLIMLSSEAPKILVPDFRFPSDFDPRGN